MDLIKLSTKKRLSMSEKEQLISKANDLGIECNIKGGCVCCFNNLAIQIHHYQMNKHMIP
jgi:hypothetical protein